MDMKAVMILLSRAVNFGVLVRGIVVADDVKVEVGGDLLIDLAQEGQPFLMAMAWGGVGEHLAGKISPRRQRGSQVPCR